jgi:hypothetical protein
VSAHGWEGFADYCKALAAEQGTGRKSLRRDWTNLRAVAARVIESIPDEVVMSLLGKAKTALNPEENDLKALVGYAVGQGLLGSEELREALDADDRASPLYWLAGLSGKSFGEKSLESQAVERVMPIAHDRRALPRRRVGPLLLQQGWC